MKLTKFTSLVLLGLIVAVAASGCRKRPTPLTVLPGSRAGDVTGVEPAPPMDTDPNAGGVTSGGYAVPDPSQFDRYGRDAEIFRANTVYFDFDSSTVKSEEASKIGPVVDHLKANPSNALSIEGHCDERGTEEYNRALGERRALALREAVIRRGVEPNRIQTITFGKDRPADPGHDQEAWRKNRRGEFILLTPPVAP